MIKLAQGAEAVLFRDKTKVIKERLSKEYRLPQLDDSLRKFRTRREAKVLRKLEEMNFPAPRLQDFSDKRMSIVMDFIPGEKLKDVLNNQLAHSLGKKIGLLHQANIIHGDLTTSNVIKAESGLKLIDFGLSFFSDKVEDKAVDLHLLDQSLASTHQELYPDIFSRFLKGYKEEYIDSPKILERLEQVKLRGRNKK